VGDRARGRETRSRQRGREAPDDDAAPKRKINHEATKARIQCGRSCRRRGEGVRERGESIREQGKRIRGRGSGIRERGESIRERGESIRERGEAIRERGRGGTGILPVGRVRTTLNGTPFKEARAQAIFEPGSGDGRRGDFGLHAAGLRVEFRPIGASPKPRYTVLETPQPSNLRRGESEG